MYIYRDTTYIYIYIFLYTEPLPPLLQSSHEWKMEEGDYRDDITVVVLTFPWLDTYDATAAETNSGDAAVEPQAA